MVENIKSSLYRAHFLLESLQYGASIFSTPSDRLLCFQNVLFCAFNLMKGLQELLRCEGFCQHHLLGDIIILFVTTAVLMSLHVPRLRIMSLERQQRRRPHGQLRLSLRGLSLLHLHLWEAICFTRSARRHAGLPGDNGDSRPYPSLWCDEHQTLRREVIGHRSGGTSAT